MTLVVTELSTYGIVMVEHTFPPMHGVTAGATRRDLDRLVAVQTVPHLPAGISAWGTGVLPTEKGYAPVSEWLAEFASRHTDVEPVSAYAEALARALQEDAAALEEPLGFHIAGYVNVDGKPLPTLYHVRNNEAVLGSYYMHKFQPVQEFPPKDPGRGVFRIRSCDCERHGVLFERLENILPAIESDPEESLTMPHPSLEGRMAFLGACVNFASDLYASAAPQGTQSALITTLGIAPNGRFSYQMHGR
jgi:hypothetical protein